MLQLLDKSLYLCDQRERRERERRGRERRERERRERERRERERRERERRERERIVSAQAPRVSLSLARAISVPLAVSPSCTHQYLRTATVVKAVP